MPNEHPAESSCEDPTGLFELYSQGAAIGAQQPRRSSGQFVLDGLTADYNQHQRRSRCRMFVIQERSEGNRYEPCRGRRRCHASDVHDGSVASTLVSGDANNRWRSAAVDSESAMTLKAGCDLRTVVHSAAADPATTARTASAPFGLPVALVNHPTTEGPTNPPRLNTVFTRAIAAAAAAPLVSAGAKHRNGGCRY
jgi:hypothetical protein